MQATDETCSAPRPLPTLNGTFVSTIDASALISLASARLLRLGVTDSSRVSLGSPRPDAMRLHILAMASAPATDHPQGTESILAP